MSDYREQHSGAVAASIDAISRLQELLAVATEQCDVAMGAILSATGSSEVESARNAMEFIAGCKTRIDETYSMAHGAVEELRRYGGGF